MEGERQQCEEALAKSRLRSEWEGQCETVMLPKRKLEPGPALHPVSREREGAAPLHSPQHLPSSPLSSMHAAQVGPQSPALTPHPPQ